HPRLRRRGDRRHRFDPRRLHRRSPGGPRRCLREGPLSKCQLAWHVCSDGGRLDLASRGTVRGAGAMRKLVPAIVLGSALLLCSVPALANAFRFEHLPRILIYVTLAASLDLMVGYTGMVNLGHAAFFGLAAYTGALLADKAGISNVLIALPAG